MTGANVKLLLVMDHPAQQFASALALLDSHNGIQLEVLYWTAAKALHDPGFERPVSWDVDLLAGYRSAACPSGLSAFRRAVWVLRYLRRCQPDVVVCYGWASTIARITIAYCAATHTKLLLYGDSTWQHDKPTWRGRARSTLLRGLMGVCAGAISTGTFNREFYIYHGLNPALIWSGVCPADVDTFAAARRASRISDADIRRSPAVKVGFAGKFIARKGVADLIRAAFALQVESRWSVTLIGTGPLLAAMQRLAAELDIADKISFRGFANTSEMPRLLAECDIVVVPSTQDMRVLVTIEAMAAGAAIVVSDATAVWGNGDLVEHGVTGLIYRSGDVAGLATQLGRLIDDHVLRAKIQDAGSQRAVAYGPAAFAETMARAAIQCNARQ